MHSLFSSLPDPIPERSRSDFQRGPWARVLLVLGGVGLVGALGGCTKLGQYYPSRTRGLAVAAHDSAEASHRELESMQQRRLVLEQEIAGLRARVSAAEAKAELCESEARAMSRGGAYSKVR